MSSYRSYTPWKSSLQTPYKSGSSSTYSSRDDVSTPRYGSLASASSYRPSFSGGTYRIKRDMSSAPTTTATTYISRYGTSSASSVKAKEDDKDKNTSAAAKELRGNSPSLSQSKINRYGAASSTSSLSKYGRSRDPSPAAVERTNSRLKSREPSPGPRTLREKTRDPSPAYDTKSKIASYGSSSYRMSTPRSLSSTGYSSRYINSSSSTKSLVPDKSISYLSVSDFRARSVSRAKESAERKSNEKEMEGQTPRNQVNSNTSNESEEPSSEEEVFVTVSVVTRATSPTPPGSANTVQRTRRIDIAKTIEKTIQRSTKKPQLHDKDIQSDRLDDPTRYSRFGLSSRVSSYSPHSESRYTPSASMRYSASPLSTTSKSSRTESSASRSENDPKIASDSTGGSITKPTRSGLALSASTSSSESKSNKSKLSPPKNVRMSSRQASVENLTASSNNINKSLPPAPPKNDSPIKNTSSSSSASSSPVKLPNKDFRKSALNVGPTDRPRKSRTPSSGTDSDDKLHQVAQPNPIPIQTHLPQRLERSSSTISEASSASSSKKENKIRPRCHPKTSSLSRSSSNSNRHGNGSASGSEVIANEHKSSVSKSSSCESSAESSKETKTSSSNSRKSNSLDTAESTGDSGAGEVAMDSRRLTSKTPVAPNSNSSSSSNRREPHCCTKTDSSSQLVTKLILPAATSVPSSSSTSNHKAVGTAKTKSDDGASAKTFLMQKLGSISNFFAARQHDTNSEPIFIESSEGTGSGGSCSGDNKISLSEYPKANTTPVTSTTNDDSSVPAAKYHLQIHESEQTKSSTQSLEATPKSRTESSSNSKLKSNSKSKSNSKTKKNSSNNDKQTPPRTAEIDSSDRSTSVTTGTNSGGDPEEPSWWQDTSEQINTSSALGFNAKGDTMHYKLRHIDSGEVGWWLCADDDDEAGDDTLADVDLKTLNQEGDEEVDASLCTDTVFSLPSSENNNSSSNNRSSTDNNNSSWWTTDNNDNELKKDYSNNTCEENNKQIADRPTSYSPWCSGIQELEYEQDSTVNLEASKAKHRLANHNVHQEELEERPWWFDEDDKSVETVTVTLPAPKFKIPNTSSSPTSPVNNLDRSSSNSAKQFAKSSNSGKSVSSEKSWWMSDTSKKLMNIQRVESGEKAWWMQEKEETNKIQENTDTQNGNDAEIQKLTEIASNNDDNAMQNYERPPPLGDRASPDGLEDPSKHRKSPFDSIPNVHPHHHHHHHHPRKSTQPLRQQQKLFISRHTNIDELLGGSCRPLSPPIIDHRRYSSPMRNVFLEEITPDQVRIHDSTAQMPVIQRMERDEWDCSSTTPIATNYVQKDELDDAALQVYKDGDYGAYLDLESSLAEQAEDIEGLNSSRKNSLVVRTQLSVRVHAIIEKLLSSEGSDLRRALFSLKQVFQEDKDLVHGFVALGGLNCLVRVGNVADQNYQNYILRALGQVMLYVDGMNGVMKHEPTMQWLYTLIASKYRLVIKTALKLLLVFVEYIESNSYLLVNAIHSVDNAKGALPWSNIMKLLKDYDNADTELLIYATSLINKTLSGLSDQDSFYDESDLLEQQGMESVIQRYMSKPGTDLDLLDQLQLYEAVLKFEDGEADGIRLPDNSVRKTLRYRSGADTAERRKSRRHSTGTSPSVLNKVIPSPKRSTPLPHGVVDEDSSSSSNSNEYSSGVFRECKGNREGAGVTPGLRRRRERAERQKSFMKEQQEAVANSIMAAFEKREDLAGHLVQAMPVIMKNGGIESPPDSLVLTNNIIINNISTTNTTIPTTNTRTSTNGNATNNSHNQLSPTKNLLGNTTISIVSNSLIASDKSPSTRYNGLAQQQQQNGGQNSANNKLLGSPEFLSKKNLLMEHNATVINGIMKNINRGNNETSVDNRSETILYNSHKKFENDTNLRNNYYSQLSSPKNHHQTNLQQTVSPVSAQTVSPKRINNGYSPDPDRTSQPNGIGFFNGNHVASHEALLETESELFISSDDIHPASPVVTVPPPPPPPLPPPPPPPPPDLMLLLQANQRANIDSTHVTTITETNCIKQTVESENEKKKLLQLKRDHTVKDLTHILSNIPTSPTQEDKSQNRIVGDMTGLISKAKEGLAKSKSKGEISRSSSVDQEIKKSEPKKSENELHWEELVKSMSRPLNLCDLDFTDLNSDDEKDVLAPRGLGGGIPPPPPPIGIPPPIGPMGHILCPPPMNMSTMIPPPMFSYNNSNSNNCNNFINTANNSLNNSINSEIGNTSTIKKNKKTVKLFWKEVREDMIPVAVGKTIWDELPDANVDTQKLEHLFESRAKDLMTKKQQELNKSKEIIVLDHKRSNAINIAMTKLPPPRAIKAAILKMDATVVTREGIDKLLNMLPTEEERGKIQEAQMSNPELPLGSAEQFLLTLASISELAARLKLWAFRLDFENSEKEIAEPLMDLKQGIESLRQNRTFKCILSTLLSVGIFLNGAPVKGFQIEYLAKVPEVKDTVHKHSLLHHLCHMVMESCKDTTDLYSEIGPITRASKADFTDLAHNLTQLETECKASWDRLKLIAKHDCPPQLKQKLVDFLADCAERIIILQIVHRRVINRYRKFLLWLGIPQHSVAESRPNEFCRIVSEFALEYRTTRERVQQQIEKKANHRERNKTRGKMIIDIGKFRTKEDRADAELKELLGTPSPGNATTDGTLTWRRRRAENLRSPLIKQSEENLTDGDDEILESLVKTATKSSGPRPTPRERKRTRHADRKSLRRTLKNGLTEEERQHVASIIKTY